MNESSSELRPTPHNRKATTASPAADPFNVERMRRPPTGTLGECPPRNLSHRLMIGLIFFGGAPLFETLHEISCMAGAPLQPPQLDRQSLLNNIFTPYTHATMTPRGVLVTCRYNRIRWHYLIESLFKSSAKSVTRIQRDF